MFPSEVSRHRWWVRFREKVVQDALPKQTCEHQQVPKKGSIVRRKSRHLGPDRSSAGPEVCPDANTVGLEQVGVGPIAAEGEENEHDEEEYLE